MDNQFYRLINRAHSWNGKIEVTGEALMLATLLKAHGPGRHSKEMTDVLRIMKDGNLE